VLAGTVRDNLTLGAPNVSDEDCEKVLESVNLSQLVNRTAEHAGLETGLDAQVGEHGILLSGGEKQRLAIARTLLGAAPVLLLDESTASLDGVNERLMREALDAVAVGRTMLVIAHRLSTVVDSDLIVVLDEGKVVGQGTHDELVKTVPLYQELARHQLLVPENT
jgi:ABC-type multidrug transport system fused ATPase/permease subunit